MRYYRRYRRRNRYQNEDDDDRYGNRYGYHPYWRRGVRISRQALRFIALGIILFVIVAILLHLAR